MPHLSLIPAARGAAADADEAVLVRRIAAGDRDALGVLYRGYHRRLARFLDRVTRRADIVDEAINDTFWIVWRQAEGFRGDSRVSTWVMGIAYRCALKALRRHGADPVDPGAGDNAAAPRDDPFAAHEVHDWIAKALARLSPEQRAAIELAYGAGHSVEEIAAILDCPVGTVKARMFHARVRLRHLLPALAERRAGGDGRG